MGGKITLLLPLFLILLAGCNQPSHTSNEIPAIVEVDLFLPEEAGIGEIVTIQAQITQGGEVVDDANEVVFEIWKNGEKDESRMINDMNQGNGLYTIETTFDEDGVYTVQVHVTARQMHVMPKKEIRIGEVLQDSSQTSEESEESHQH